MMVNVYGDEVTTNIKEELLLDFGCRSYYSINMQLLIISF
jgi:hypothetical protein